LAHPTISVKQIATQIIDLSSEMKQKLETYIMHFRSAILVSQQWTIIILSHILFSIVEYPYNGFILNITQQISSESITEDISASTYMVTMMCTQLQEIWHNGIKYTFYEKVTYIGQVNRVATLIFDQYHQ
jgi:hypothetical protein